MCPFQHFRRILKDRRPMVLADLVTRALYIYPFWQVVSHSRRSCPILGLPDSPRRPQIAGDAGWRESLTWRTSERLAYPPDRRCILCTHVTDALPPSSCSLHYARIAGMLALWATGIFKLLSSYALPIVLLCSRLSSETTLKVSSQRNNVLYSEPQKSWPLLPYEIHVSRGHDFCGPLYMRIANL